MQVLRGAVGAGPGRDQGRVLRTHVRKQGQTGHKMATDKQTHTELEKKTGA
mgnify:CR=1 FL=1